MHLIGTPSSIFLFGFRFVVVVCKYHCKNQYLTVDSSKISHHPIRCNYFSNLRPVDLRQRLQEEIVND